MNLEPIVRTTLVEKVAARIRAAIIDGSLQSGDSLPSERNLAARLGVNRSSVREALQRLEAQGFVEVKQGGATRVRDAIASAGLTLLPYLLGTGSNVEPKVLVDLLEMRVMLVAWTGRTAATTATDADLVDLQALLDALDAAAAMSDDRDALQAADWAFFERLVDATGNQVLELIVSAVRKVYDANQTVFGDLYDGFDTCHHHAALDAIRKGDGDGASSALAAFGQRAVEIAKRRPTKNDEEKVV